MLKPLAHANLLLKTKIGIIFVQQLFSAVSIYTNVLARLSFNTFSVDTLIISALLIMQ